jgi:hypothetical protein
LRTVVISVEMNGRPLAFKMLPNQNDQHLAVRFQLNSGTNSLVIRTRNDFGLSLANDLPPLGSVSRGIRVLSESWNGPKSQLTLDVSGLAGERCQLSVWNPAQVSSVDGGTLSKTGSLEIQMPPGTTGSYVPQKVILHFGH